MYNVGLTSNGIQWSGVTIWPPALPTASRISDASDTWGCEAYQSELQSPVWFQLQRPAGWENEHISAKEMVPVVVAAALWGQSWTHSQVVFRSDNSQVVAAINSGTSCNRIAAHLTRCLCFITASYQFVATARHIPGRLNSAADALSRKQHSKFVQLLPSAFPSPTAIPSSLQEWVMNPHSCWTGGDSLPALWARLSTIDKQSIRNWEEKVHGVLQAGKPRPPHH